MSEKFQGEDTKDTKPIKKENDILIEVYKPKETMYTDQTGKFPHVSSQWNRYMMVLDHIDSYSIWVEPMNNITQGETMLARQRALQQMHAVEITPKRQGLDIKKSMVYRQEIMETGMTYQLVPPDDHRRNISEKKSKRGNTTSLKYAAVSPLTFQCTYGAGSSYKQRKSCYYSDNQMSTQKNQLLLTYMDRITITRNHSSPLAWNP